MLFKFHLDLANIYFLGRELLATFFAAILQLKMPKDLGVNTVQSDAADVGVFWQPSTPAVRMQ